jgi:hypothetical protein
VFGVLANSVGKSIPQGAATTLYAAVSPQLDGKDKGGRFYADCNEWQPSHPALTAVSDLAKRLWEASARITGSDFP